MGLATGPTSSVHEVGWPRVYFNESYKMLQALFVLQLSFKKLMAFSFFDPHFQNNLCWFLSGNSDCWQIAEEFFMIVFFIFTFVCFLCPCYDCVIAWSWVPSKKRPWSQWDPPISYSGLGLDCTSFLVKLFLTLFYYIFAKYLLSTFVKVCPLVLTWES